MTEQNEEQKKRLSDLIDEIKSLVSTEAFTKIRIGELLNENIELINHGEKLDFYKSIGMNPRTAQYYMKIAANEDVQKLKAEDKLKGLNMSAILNLVGMRINVRGDNNTTRPNNIPAYVHDDNFEFESCRSTSKFKVEYEYLSNKVSELEAELDKLRPTTKAS